ncbi:MAG: DUF502 domain-containing protein [Proteobacteria bacterium]|nr:DUF502 domain-containing protein [Pseudomonadota bacterium]MBS0463831.1 DUF502 domain-containing protein [Pseudomonadota bacterium]
MPSPVGNGAQTPAPETVLSTLRGLFVTGLLTLLPLWLTFVVFKFVFGLLSDSSRPLIGPLLVELARQSPSLAWLADPWALTAIGVIATVLLILAVGLLAQRVAGQRLLAWFEAAIRRIPLAKTVYGSSRQLLDMMSSPSGSGQRVVLVEFPHPGVRSVGFLTRTLREDATSRQLASVFVPTTPNPTGGYLLVVPVEDLVATDWTVDQAMTFIISGGAVTPPSMPFAATRTEPAGTRMPLSPNPPQPDRS